LRRPADRRAAAVAVILTVTFSLAPDSVAESLQRLPATAELPKVYSWIAAEPQVRALLELPAYADHRDLDYVYAWLAHGKPILNGYSGLFPEAYSRLVELCAGARTIPAACVRRARELGATHVALHSGPFLFETSRRRRPKQLAPGSSSEVELAYADERTRVYRLR
jgi:hypothetical protein